MKKGDEIQVNVIWASGGPNQEPLRDWVDGYAFERDDTRYSDCVIVKHSTGIFAGCEVRFRREDVRMKK